jgi:hypothetical protein
MMPTRLPLDSADAALLTLTMMVTVLPTAMINAQQILEKHTPVSVVALQQTLTATMMEHRTAMINVPTIQTRHFLASVAVTLVMGTQTMME